MMSRRKIVTKKNLDDSAVVVWDSPVSSIKQRGNLTGNARMMRDHVLEMNNLTQMWNVELIEGATSIAEIKAVMYKKINANEDLLRYCGPILREQLCALQSTCTKMRKIVEDMGQLVPKILAVHELERRKISHGSMFLTWPTFKFVDISQHIYEMYKRELAVKMAVKSELCFCTDRETLIFLEATWLQEPYIDKCISLNHETMLQEIGCSRIRKK